jgi:pimeloyl-ACP methyl ester carboxylesterase
MKIQSFGSGPGIVVVHGSIVTSRVYVRLARALSSEYTIHLYDRRVSSTYTVKGDIADLAGVLERTGARNIFGHSMGGFVALRAALDPHLKPALDRVAVYDPAVPLSGGFPSDFLDPFESAIKTGDYARALAVMGRGLRDSGPATKLPLGIQVLFAKAFLGTSVGREWQQALRFVPAEAREALRHDGPAGDYSGISAKVLLMRGARSPRYYAAICESLATAIPGAETLAIPGASHNGPNIARPRLTRPLIKFYGVREAHLAGRHRPA